MNSLILNSSATSEGTWTQVDSLISPFSVSVYGFSGLDAAQIYVSNTYAQPATLSPVAGDGTMQFGPTLTSDTVVTIQSNFRWLRVRKSAADATPATTKAYLQGLTQTV